MRVLHGRADEPHAHQGAGALRQRAIRGEELAAEAGRQRDVEGVARGEVRAERMCRCEEPRERYALRPELREEGEDPVQRAGREPSLAVEAAQRAVDLSVEVGRYRDRRLADRIRCRGAGLPSG